MASLPSFMHGRRLAWNSLLNFATGGAIFCIKIAFVPLMIRSFGTEFYGVLSVTWMVLANFAWFDLGFSRATAKYVAHDLALGRSDGAVSWVWTAVLTQLCIGAIAAFIVWEFAPAIVNLFHVAEDKKVLVTMTLSLFAVSIPLDFAGRSLTGVLEAGQRFDWINALNLFDTIGTFAVYSLGIWRTDGFVVVVYGLLVLRFVSLALRFVAAAHVLPEMKSLGWLRELKQYYWDRVGVMIRFGSWMSLASVVGPGLFYLDQWVIGGVIGIAFLPFYTIPCNLLTHLGILSGSINSTLFPAFSGLEALKEQGRMEGFFVRAHRYLLVSLIPVVFVLIVWSSDLLRIWITPEFASQASLPLKILAVGYGIGLFATMSGALLEAIGRPDLVVKLYLAELPVYVPMVILMTKHFGIVGPAISYGIRAFLEVIFTLVLLYRVVPFSWGRLMREGILWAALAIIPMSAAGYGIRTFCVNPYQAMGATALILALYCVWTLKLVLDRDDKQLVLQVIKKRGK